MARAVVGEDPQGHVDLVLVTEAASGDLLPQLDQRLESVGQEHRIHVLLDGGHPFQAHPGVDVLGGKGVSLWFSSML